MNNLREALMKKNISIRDYSSMLGITEKSAQNKLSEKTDFTYTEFKMTCALLPEYNPAFLFAQDR